MLNIIDWAAHEVQRQEDEPLAVYDMMVGWGYAMEAAKTRRTPNIADAMAIAMFVKPEYNGFNGRHHNFRVTPVVFKNGGTAASPSTVAMAIERHFDHIDILADSEDLIVELAMVFTRNLLNIHPWRDGNGRTAVILYNWWNKTLADPLPLPDFYGAEGHACSGEVVTV